jgi:hypothetical protein
MTRFCIKERTMLRKVVPAVVVLLFCVGITLAEDIRAIITKVDGNKVTFAENKGKGEKGDSQTLEASATVKVNKGKFNKDTKKLEAGDPVDGGLKAEQFTKIGEKGLPATITVEDKKITSIIVFGGKAKATQQ